MTRAMLLFREFLVAPPLESPPTIWKKDGLIIFRTVTRTASYAKQALPFESRLSRLSLSSGTHLQFPSPANSKRPDALSGLHALLLRAGKEKVGTGGRTNGCKTYDHEKKKRKEKKKKHQKVQENRREDRKRGVIIRYVASGH